MQILRSYQNKKLHARGTHESVDVYTIKSSQSQQNTSSDKKPYVGKGIVCAMHLTNEIYIDAHKVREIHCITDVHVLHLS